ncbi:MAG TPA: hypothetical protein VFX59_24840 [Polyangiales bacterium]|nr:hypothetical protein [Polyangiales bacterium]
MRSADAFALLLLGACAADPKPSAPKPTPAPTHYLGETFQLGSAACQLVRAAPALTEPRLRPIGRPPEDIAVVAVALACAAGSNVRWLDDARIEHTPSTRTALSERAPELTVFEVALRSAGASTPRRYDAKTGDPRGTRELRRARLLVDELVIAPWPRQHDDTLDGFLDQLARTLASGAPFDTLSDSEEGHAAIRAAAELYQRIVARSDQLVVRTIGLPRITLALEQAGGAELTSFQLELDLSRGQPRVLRAHGLDTSRADVQCSEDAASVRARVEQLKPREGDCNALGTLLPGSCPEQDPTLVRDTLRVSTHCELDPALGLDTRAPAAPADFELRFRRTRTFARMERAPHYGLVVQRNGRVLFDGQQRVKALGAHEGRTSYQMVAALADRFSRTGWFERQDGETCRASDDRGDQLEVRMNGRARTLRDRDGCRGGFTARELELARAAIERAVGMGAWLDDPGPSTPRTMRDSEIWMVAAE